MVSIEATAEVVTACLSGELDHHEVRKIREEIDSSIERECPKLLILDFSGVGFMDSSGIGLIMGRYKRMRNYGGSVEVTNVSRRGYKVMRMAGLEKLVKIEVSEK